MNVGLIRMPSVIDLKTYMHCISRLLNRGIIEVPKSAKELFNLRVVNGNVLGWEIKNQEILFNTSDYLDVDEKASYKSSLDGYIINEYSYHFNASEKNSTESYRLDNDKRIGPHANDERSGINKHLLPHELKLDILDLNLYIAIHLALLYISNGKYPLDSCNGDQFNIELLKKRKDLK